ncbi:MULTISPECIES: enhanced serine sensitivity protein SseB C-terminal domain-containing protein [unclassified Arsenophonus]|uniref:enhanced serine sensitivity protein SseB C-terminal domain-containing protein n=1 Tax=unclassified Arsenophonus TaxID=2627083 RepID=UPI0028668ED7|nr:enhanced serine sensitivity protein SseB C-terminal domain-containing protein [Arsenophonus sp.]MDR5609707.1 enhanced serine sensitivity protein SseB C-terminal domain-containing protein [Arsenophonus sp.]MDR5613401.1 enhanced serine sensitivity protein SseB C-terminal domain-containing protein [Arsenophonus sp.]
MAANKINQAALMTTITVPGGSVIKLRIPETMPQQLINVLCQFFQQHKIIRRAFLLQAEDDTVVEASVMLIALEINIGYEKEGQLLIPQLGSMALDYLEANQSVDFYFLQPNSTGIDHFIVCHTQPFYQRKIGGWLRSTIAVKNC